MRGRKEEMKLFIVHWEYHSYRGTPPAEWHSYMNHREVFEASNTRDLKQQLDYLLTRRGRKPSDIKSIKQITSTRKATVRFD